MVFHDSGNDRGAEALLIDARLAGPALLLAIVIASWNLFLAHCIFSAKPRPFGGFVMSASPLMLAAAFPYDRPHGPWSQRITGVILSISAATALYILFRTLSLPRPCWEVVAVSGFLISASSVSVAVRYVVGWDRDVWKQVRGALGFAAGVQLARTLCLAALLGVEDPVFPPGEQTLPRALEYGAGMLFGATIVASPAVRMAVSKASGIASLYVLNLPDLRHTPVELLAPERPESATNATASSAWPVNDPPLASVEGSGSLRSRGIRTSLESSDVVR